MIITGKTNSILDVGGLRVGQAHDQSVKTGVTVILPDKAALCSVDIRGGGPGTRETDTLSDGGLIDHVHAITLSGGSVYGLAAADGVCAWLGDQRIGYAPGPSPIPVSPIVPSAILFDNANGGNKDWGLEPPFRDLALEACEQAAKHLTEGKAGSGYGATAGLYEGGLGSASEIIDGITIGALIAANPVGSPYMPGTQCFWAWPYEVNGEFGGARPPADYTYKAPTDTKLTFLKSAGQSTVIGVVATNAKLSQKQLKRLSIMAQELSAGDKSCEGPVDLAELGAAAARCVARALSRGVYHAREGSAFTHGYHLSTK